LNFPYQLPVHDRVFVISETHVFSPRLVNDFRFGLVHINNTATNINPVTVDDVGIDRPTSNLTTSIYKFTFATSGFQFGPTPQANQSQKQNNYNFVDDLSWVHGAHTLTFGGQYVRVRLDKLFPQVFNGQLFFVNTGTSDFGNFVGGTPAFSFGGGGVYNHAYKQSNSAVFAQDDWKATQTLTLNLGLRTEFLGAWTDGDCHIGNIESDLTNSGISVYLSELREQAGSCRAERQRSGIDVPQQHFNRVGSARWICLGRNGPPYDDVARRIWNLLRARRRGSGRPVELPVAVYPNRVFRANAGIYDVELLYWHARDKPQRRTRGRRLEWRMASLPGTVHGIRRRQRQSNE
jgi:hypothetical protein